MTTVQEIEEYMSGLAEAMSRVDRKSIESMVDTLMGAYESEAAEPPRRTSCATSTRGYP